MTEPALPSGTKDGDLLILIDHETGIAKGRIHPDTEWRDFADLGWTAEPEYSPLAERISSPGEPLDPTGFPLRAGRPVTDNGVCT